MASNTTNAAVQVEPDSNGNVIITIKLVIATAIDRSSALNIPLTFDAEASHHNPPSENLLSDSQSNGSSTTVYEQEENNADTNTIAPPYSLRSRVRVEEEDDDSAHEEEYEVDYALSQQVGIIRLNESP